MMGASRSVSAVHGSPFVRNFFMRTDLHIESPDTTSSHNLCSGYNLTMLPLPCALPNNNNEREMEEVRFASVILGQVAPRAAVVQFEQFPPGCGAACESLKEKFGFRGTALINDF